MESSDVCPKCGRSLVQSDHKCLPNEENMIYQINDDEDSTPFLDKVVNESESFEDVDSTSMRAESQKLEDNYLERTGDDCNPLYLPSWKKTPLISEGNPPSPPEEEIFMEENQEDLFEEINALGENFENVLEFLEIDTSLYSDDSINIVSQLGNPLDGLPSESLVTDHSKNVKPRKNKNAKSGVARKGPITTKDSVKTKIDSDLRSNQQSTREIISKGDCWTLNPTSLLRYNEPQNAHEEVLTTHPTDSQAGISRTYRRTISPLIKSPLKAFTTDRSGKNLSPKRNNIQRTLSHKQKSPKRASAALSSSSQASLSRTDGSEYSRTISPSKYSQVESFPEDVCGKTLGTKKNYKNRMQEKSPNSLSSDTTGADKQEMDLFKEHQNAPEEASANLHPGSPAISPSKRGPNRHSRTESKKHHSKGSDKGSFPCKECGRVLNSKKTYINHLFLHKNLKPCICEECGKAFATKPYLKKHLRRHTEERRFPCSVCGHRFEQFVHLQQHLLIHTGEQPFVCEICGRAFTHQRSYTRHSRRHTK